MMLYVNTHAALEQMRQKAEDEETRGPRVSNLRMHEHRCQQSRNRAGNPAFLYFCQNVPHFWLYFEIKKISENRNNFSCTETFCAKKLCKNVSNSIT